MKLSQLVNDIITTTAGDSVDIARVMGLIGFAIFLGLAIYTVVGQHQPFHMQDFGIGFGGVVGGTGVAIKLNTDNKT